MPILWRYMLTQYLRVLGLCTAAFVAILLIMRLDEIARFATLGPAGIYILLFTLHQIPYIIPIAIPISALISTILLIQRLSVSHELTALRACGIALRDILAPILIAAAFLSAVNFYIVSEMATHSHLASGLLKSELRAVNPLLLLHNKQLMRLKGFYFDTLGASQMGESASDIVLAVPNKNNDRLTLIVAKDLKADGIDFSGQHVTLVSGLRKNETNQFDSLMLENIEQARTTTADFAQMVHKKVWTLNYDHFRMPLLMAKLYDEKQALAQARQENQPESSQKQILRTIHRCYTEMARRLSIAVAPFTFTLMGAAFGMNISRMRSSRGLAVAVGLVALYLIAYFSAKGIDHHLMAASLLYAVPHGLIILLSAWSLTKVSKGVE